jgi:hypothetical protein
MLRADVALKQAVALNERRALRGFATGGGSRYTADAAHAALPTAIHR